MTWSGLRGQKDAPPTRAPLPPAGRGRGVTRLRPQRLPFPAAAPRDVDSPWITRTVGVRVPTINWKTRLGIVFPWEFGGTCPGSGLSMEGLCAGKGRKGTVDDGWSPSINADVTLWGTLPQSQMLLYLIALGTVFGQFKAKETM